MMRAKGGLGEVADSAPPVTAGMRLLDRFRGREVRVRGLERIGHLLRLEVEGPDGVGEVLTLPAAMVAERFAPVPPPAPFGADPEVVRQVAEGHRLAHAYLFDPFFATETSLIHPLPHQFIAVYDHLLRQERLRFLLADDAGAGKTIMTGLYVRHQLLAGALQRVLVVAPAGLVGNWRQELWRFFHLRFEIAEREETLAGNPFAAARFDLAVVSLDTAARPRVRSLLAAPGVPPYDLVVFDEAHKLSAARDANLVLQATERYRLAEALGARTRHLLLLTATPHMGKDEPYAALWRLLDPDRFASPEAVWRLGPAERPRHLLRRLKEQITDAAGAPLFPPRTTRTVGYPLTGGGDGEAELYGQVTAYCERYYRRAEGSGRAAARLAMALLQRRLAGRTAIRCSLRTRQERLQLALNPPALPPPTPASSPAPAAVA